ncbi:MAG: hypothetical protein DRJ63_01860 [Thermoprotei archaeon]|nr:MAG: hypothetical protein DRJ63_01860 [Thermoprotei archaeon]
MHYLEMSYLVFERTKELVSKYFYILYSEMEGLIPVFYIQYEKDLKKKFKYLALEAKREGFLPLLRQKDEYLVIKVVPFKAKRRNPKTALILFAATFFTVLIDGFIRASDRFLPEIIGEVNVPLMTISYTVALLAVIGVHEMGHKIASMIHQVKTSLPYFIPALPGIGIGGTFGAVILQEEPPTNKDELFDIGLSGPIFGFIATIAVTLVAAKISGVVSVKQLKQWTQQGYSFTVIPTPLLMTLIFSYYSPLPGPDYMYYLHPLAFVSWAGFIITALNLFPVWQLDGGHVIRALLGPKKARILSILSVILMAALGYWFMALVLLLFMMIGGKPVEPLDNVSPLSLSRKLLILGYIIILILCLPLPW